ncbi:MAG: amidohydrolase family protein, partial [Myxococcota bacterium]
GSCIAQIAMAGSLVGKPGEMVREGGMMTPHLAEPHVHLDATQLGSRTPNLSGTLHEGIANWAAVRDTLTAEDIQQRAKKTIGWYRSWGCTRIRTHVDTGNLGAVEALIDLREQLKAEVEIQVVAFPQEGLLKGPGQTEQWRAAVKLGCDAVGAIPHFENDLDTGWQTVQMAFDLAEEFDRDLDFHCDETDDPNIRNLEEVCRQAKARGNGVRVIAGHCTALHSYPDDVAARVISDVVEAQIQVVTNPLDNIVLQGRNDGYPKRRGITRVDELWAAGATVGIGHDSVVDPWYRLGTANLVDAAHMLVHAGHLTSDAHMRQVFRTLHDDNHRCFGGVKPLQEGAQADVLFWPVEDPIEVIRVRPRPEVFIKGVQVD